MKNAILRDGIFLKGKRMKRTIILSGKTYEYELEKKKVKNLNLRVRRDGSIYVSVPVFVKISEVEEFLGRKEDFLKKALEKREETPLPELFALEELKEIVQHFLNIYVPYFEKRNCYVMAVKFRTMKTRWGSCHTRKGVLTFNTHLRYASERSIEYVVVHELCHLLVPNHSPLFYKEVEKLLPDYKERRKELKGITISLP